VPFPLVTSAVESTVVKFVRAIQRQLEVFLVGTIDSGPDRVDQAICRLAKVIGDELADHTPRLWKLDHRMQIPFQKEWPGWYSATVGVDGGSGLPAR
jgi:Mn-dependent DtxR family transcriptional regulator